jgi:SRSO17 transposase
MDFCGDYSRHFVLRGNDSNEHAKHYLSGLLGTQRRKNIGRIGEDVAESNYQGMQQFITDSPWDHQAVMAQVAQEAVGVLGGHRDTALYLDETSFVKKGDASVGVQRQYCGRLGKLENCQVGVFACLGRGERSALVDFRLFLPEEWAKDPARCNRVKIPPQERVHRTKCELALAMVKQARERQLGHRWIGGDAIYGNNQEFCAALEELGETFLMDVSHNVVVWDEDPQPQAQPAPPRGRPRTRSRAANEKAACQSVAKLTAAQFERENQMLTLRETTKGPLRVQVWVQEVWLWNPRTEQRARRRLLVVRRDADGSFKYSLSNAPADTSWARLAYMQAQRFFIERAFEDAKSELGMAQYEVRGWRGWHHHITLCCMALLFALKERIAFAENIPLLTVRDIVELLASYLPRRSHEPGAVLANLQARHAARASAINSARNRSGPVTK